MEIQNYPNYLIYSNGKVWSKKRKSFLKQQPDPKGYLKIRPSHNGVQETLKIHRLVAIHYIPNPNNFSQVDHIDRNKQNNDVSNLRWVNNSKNQMNVGIKSSNTSGHKNIYYHKGKKRWVYERNHFKIHKCFKTKTEALCYKYIMLLKIISMI